MPLQGAIVARGAIAGCHCRVRWLGGVTTDFGGVDVVALQGAMVGGLTLAEWTWCHCRVPLQCVLVGGEGDELWRGGRGAIAGCRCSVIWWGGGGV